MFGDGARLGERGWGARMRGRGGLEAALGVVRISASISVRDSVCQQYALATKFGAEFGPPVIFLLTTRLCKEKATASREHYKGHNPSGGECGFQVAFSNRRYRR